MKIKSFVLYVAGFFIACGIGYYYNYVVGFLAGMVLYVFFLMLLGFIVGLTDANPTEKSIYDRRKKVE